MSTTGDIHKDILGELYLYINWFKMSRHFTTEQKEAWADAVDEWSDSDLQAWRWWREEARHNHMTRDIKEKGKCPACDSYWESHVPR